jgi:TIR domain
MSGQIFISYRREDAAHPAGRLHVHLAQKFPKSRIFMDIDSLDPGEDFAEAIEKSVGSCDILIAVIGQRWLDARDVDGTRRLDKPDDFVRLEISTALKRGIRVMPVLVDGASMPKSTQLPDDLQPLVRRQAVEVTHNRFATDSERIINAINRAFEASTASGAESKTSTGKKPLVFRVREFVVVLIVIFGTICGFYIGGRVIAPSAPSSQSTPTPPPQSAAASTPAPTPESTPAPVSTPTPMPTLGSTGDHADISGQWRDEIGTVYYVNQRGGDYTFQARNPRYGSSQGFGTITENKMISQFTVTTLSGQTGMGTGSGTLVGDNKIITESSDSVYGAYEHTLWRQ